MFQYMAFIRKQFLSEQILFVCQTVTCLLILPWSQLRTRKAKGQLSLLVLLCEANCFCLKVQRSQNLVQM